MEISETILIGLVTRRPVIALEPSHFRAPSERQRRRTLIYLQSPQRSPTPERVPCCSVPLHIVRRFGKSCARRVGMPSAFARKYRKSQHAKNAVARKLHDEA